MHVGKQAKAHEHVSHSDYSPRDQVVESDLSLNKTTGLGGLKDALKPRTSQLKLKDAKINPDTLADLARFAHRESINTTPQRSGATPSKLLNRLLSRGVTR